MKYIRAQYLNTFRFCGPSADNIQLQQVIIIVVKNAVESIKGFGNGSILGSY